MKLFIRAFLILVFCLATNTLDANAHKKSDPRTVKASFITNFINFTRWPEETQNIDNSIFSICIIGEDPYSEILKHYPKKGIQGRPLVVTKLDSDLSSISLNNFEQLKQCHVLVVLFKKRSHTESLLSQVSKLPVLTISEIANGHKQKSMINLINKNDRIAFSINRTSAREAGIEFSSKLLRLAENVIGGGK